MRSGLWALGGGRGHARRRNKDLRDRYAISTTSSKLLMCIDLMRTSVLLRERIRVDHVKAAVREQLVARDVILPFPF